MISFLYKRGDVYLVLLQKKTQGITGEWNYRKEVASMLSNEKYHRFTIATAFATENGVNLLEEAWGNAAGKVKVYVGVRNGVTTYQAIVKLLAVGAKVYGVDTGSAAKIFHEKTYTAGNDEEAIVLTGSGNLTRGGLIANIESGVLAECNFQNENDFSFYQSCLEQLEILEEAYPQNVYDINLVMAGKLLESGILLDEKKTVPRTVKGTAGTNTVSVEVPPMKTYIEKTGGKKVGKVADPKENYVLAVPEETESEYDLLNFKELWQSKELTSRDLNIPSNGSTNPTGSMLLKKGVYDINQQSYFYEEAFADLNWTPGIDKKQVFLYAKAHFDFLIDDVFIKGHELLIKHDPRTNTKTYLQKQPMTHLLWGEAKTLISKPHLLNEVMTLYKNKNEDGKYLIKIESAE